MRLILILLTLALAGCSNNPTTSNVLEAVKIRDDQCGTATLTGNVEVGGMLGFFGSTVTVHIDKSKQTYVDENGNPQACP